MQRFKDLLSVDGDKDAFNDLNRVQVNQRHLIDKILARYSSRFTIYREMIQNANDACATEMEILFYSRNGRNDGKSSISTSTLSTNTTTSQTQINTTSKMIDSIEIRNNGRPFNADDWKRLTRIAEGNPEEDKIGFFGVGFYSLFSVCEHPIVVSGTKILRFRWLKDQLYAVPGTTSSISASDADTEWTSIFLELRNPESVADWDSFSKFIAKSILFTRNLQGIRVLHDEKEVFSFKKEFILGDEGLSALTGSLFKVPIDSSSPVYGKSSSSSSSSSSMLSSFLSTLTSTEEEPFFRTTSIEIYNVTLHWKKCYDSNDSSDSNAEQASDTKQAKKRSIWDIAMLWTARQTKRILSISKWDPEHMSKGSFSIGVKLLKTSFSTHLPSTVSSEMQRVMKKSPPRNSGIEIIISGDCNGFNSCNGCNVKDLKQQQQQQKQQKIHPLLLELLPSPEQDHKGHLYVGFETHQDLGGFHLNVQGPFVPTVERESLDFVDPFIARWNEALLFLLGKYVRLLYHMMSLQGCAFDGSNSGNSVSGQGNNGKNCFSVVKYFSPVQQSTPSPLVSSKILQTFISSSPIANIPLPTRNRGLLPLSDLRSIPSTYPKNMLKLSALPLLLEIPNSLTDLFSCGSSDSSAAMSSFCIQPLSINECLANTRDDLDSVGYSTLFTFLEDQLQRGGSVSPAALLSIGSLKEIKYYPSPLLLLYPPPSPPAGIIWMEERPIFNWINWKIYDIFDYITMFLNDVDVYCGAKEQKNGDTKQEEEKQQKQYIKCTKFCNYLAKLYKNERDEMLWSRVSSMLQRHQIIPCQDGSLCVPGKVFTRSEDDPLIPKDCSIVSSIVKGEEPFLLGIGLRGHLDLGELLKTCANDVDASFLLPHLQRIKDQLSGDEIKALKEGKYFPSSSDDEMHPISSLYLPSPLAKRLGLPLIKNCKRENYSFLLELGITERPSLDSVLQGIQADNSIFELLIREVEKEKNSYVFKKCHLSIPFIPCKGAANDGLLGTIDGSFLDDELLLFSHSTEKEAAPFKVVEDDWKWIVKRLWNVKQAPGEQEIRAILEEGSYPPQNAPAIFSYLDRFTFLKNCSCKVVLPVIDGSKGTSYEWHDIKYLFYRKPSSPLMLEVVNELSLFKECSSFYISTSSQRFLQEKLGVAENFGKEMLITSLIGGHLRVLEKIGSEGYQKLLHHLSLSPPLGKKEKESIAKAPILLGIHFTKSENSDILERSFSLGRPSDIFFPDDTVSQNLFNLLIVPEGLYGLYKELGCKRITEVVDIEYYYSKPEPISSHPILLELQERIRERAPLLLHSLTIGQHGMAASTTEKLKVLKLLKTLKVFFCSKMQIQRSHSGKRDVKGLTAFYDGGNLMIGGRDGYDAFEIGQTLRSRMIISCNGNGITNNDGNTTMLSDSLLFSSFLTEPLDVLRQKGFPVDLLLGSSIKDSINYDSVNVSKSLDASTESFTDCCDRGTNESVRDSLSENDTNNNNCFTPTSSSTSSITENTAKKSSSNLQSMFSKMFLDANKAIKKTFKTTTNSSLEDQLKNGIRNCRTLDQRVIDGMNESTPPPPPTPPPLLPEELSDRCIFPSQLILRYKVSSKDDRDDQSPIAFYTVNEDTLTKEEMPSKEFIKIIRGLEVVFGFDKLSIGRQSLVHLYLDATPRTIAFNRSGSLFLNVFFWDAKKSSVDNANYWYMIMCHELAHNQSSQHDIVHGKYMMLYAEKFLGRFIKTFYNK